VGGHGWLQACARWHGKLQALHLHRGHLLLLLLLLLQWRRRWLLLWCCRPRGAAPVPPGGIFGPSLLQPRRYRCCGRLLLLLLLPCSGRRLELRQACQVRREAGQRAWRSRGWWLLCQGLRRGPLEHGAARGCHCSGGL
jgi:hypothetical protein